MNKPPLVLIGLILLGISGFIILNQKTSKTTPQILISPSPTLSPQVENVSFKASFLIFTNGTKRDFSDSRYHNLSEDVFIEKDSPTTVNVKRANITWGDFFKSLPMQLSRDCIVTGTKQTFCNSNESSLKFYINGKRTNDFLNTKINNNDKALITFGSGTEDEIQSQLNQIPEPN